MIGMVVVGVALGAVLFSLIIKIVPPKRSAIVELGRFYAHYRGSDATAAPARTAADRQGRIGVFIASERTVIAEILGRAGKRGELVQESDPDLAHSLLLGSISRRCSSWTCRAQPNSASASRPQLPPYWKGPAHDRPQSTDNA